MPGHHVLSRLAVRVALLLDALARLLENDEGPGSTRGLATPVLGDRHPALLTVGRNGAPILPPMEAAMTDARLVRPLWRGRTNVDALTIACIEHAEQIVRERHPKIAHEFVCTQGSYQGSSGDPDSGTTHRLGGAVDLRWCGHPECYEALREAGMFIWHRFPWQGDWPDHFHGAPIDHPYMDARLAAQEASYLAGGNGIGGTDDGPRLNPIPRPLWPWPPEDDMADPKTQAQLDRIEKGIKSLRKKTAERHQTLIRTVRQGLDGIATEVKDDATKGQVVRVRKALDELAAALEDDGAGDGA